jgi:hypothetical protein
MNDLRRLLFWLATLGVLAVGVWGFHVDEVTAARPFAPENRAFRQTHSLSLFGHQFALPLAGMAIAWAMVAVIAAALWPLATSDRSRKVFGRWERSAHRLGKRE